MSAFGSITYQANRWRIACEPHVRTKLKRLFPQVDQRAGDFVLLSDTEENCRDLLWFIQRYPMEVADLARLERGASHHIERESIITELLEHRRPPEAFELAIPARDYQTQAATLAEVVRGLLVADDVGLGKTVTSICPMARPENLPVLVVTLSHLPKQWRDELADFAPELKVHILKSGQPYDLIPKRRGKQATLFDSPSPRLPDVIISNYHKLRGWSEMLAGVVRYVVFDEVQELRHPDSAKYAAARHVAEHAALRTGLSVGPQSELELMGGPFGCGWIGPIESAWQLLRQIPATHIGEYEVVEVEILGIVSRGWTPLGFAWKPVMKFIRHRCTKPVRTLRTGGASLVVTDDHSVFEVLETGLASKPSDAFVAGNLVALDNGANWENDRSLELAIDVLPIAADISRAQVVVDLSNVSRRQLGLKAWQWHNCHREATYGPRLPMPVYLQHRAILPQPTTIYLGRGKAPSLPPKVMLSDWSYVLGFYLGDGWVTHDRVNFAVEIGRADAFCVELAALGIGLRPLIRKMSGASVEIRCSNRLFAALMLQVTGGAKCFEKRIPAEWILTWPLEARRRLLDGLVDSDGHISEGPRNRLGAYFVTTSRRLALDLQSLLRSLGITGGLHVRMPSNGGKVGERNIVGRRKNYQVHWSQWAFIGDSSGRRGKRNRFEWSRKMLNEAVLRSISIADSPEYVYDLEMEGHPSFTANGILVHNSATPIYNYGVEFFHVIEVLRPGALGTREEFLREWCDGTDRVKDAKAFGEYLRREGLMIRRTRKDVGRELPKVSTIPYTIDCDTKILDGVKSRAVELANLILSTQPTARGAKFHAGEEFNVLMRQATGIAKAVYVAAFVRLLVESGQKVVLYGWHRAVYDIWLEQLRDLNPRLYTGSESPRQKDEAKEAFIQGDCRVLIISLRAGAGLDGLQAVCNTAVFGEIDYSPGAHTQCIGRLDRDGQENPVMAYFLLSEDGSDPIIANIVGIKREQSESVLDPNAELIEKLEIDPGYIKTLAAEFLRQQGMAPEPVARQDVDLREPVDAVA